MLLQALLQTATDAGAVNVADSAKVRVQNLAQGFVDNPNQAMSDLVSAAIHFGLKIVAALIIYIVGAWIIRRIKKLLNKIFERRETEATLSSFVSSLVSITLTGLLIIITISTLGINTTSIAALLAAGGMAVGMALSGTVQNFAGGIMILIFKPFKAGDFVHVQGEYGTVKEVTIVSTILTTVDSRTIIIPNGTLSNSNIENYSKEPLKRIEWTFGFEYGVDADKCIEELLAIVSEHPKIMDGSVPEICDAPSVVLKNLAASSVEFRVRAWVKTEDLFTVMFDINKEVYSRMPNKGFKFPFPQMDVHMKMNS